MEDTHSTETVEVPGYCTAFMLSSFIDLFSSCLAGFTGASLLRFSSFAVEGSLENAQPVAVSKNMEKIIVVTMDMGPP
jgi:hypothetical protein